MEFLLAAMILIESGGDPFLVGKQGERGPLQIKRVYWQEACRQLLEEGTPAAELPGYDARVRDAGTSKRIAQAYWRRYCSEALRNRDWQVLARVHNGGPEGDGKSTTVDYWKRVQKTMWRLEAQWRRERQTEPENPLQPPEPVTPVEQPANAPPSEPAVENESASSGRLLFLSMAPESPRNSHVAAAKEHRSAAHQQVRAKRDLALGGPMLLLAALVVPLVVSTLRPRALTQA
jgi:hypothetical protein